MPNNDEAQIRQRLKQLAAVTPSAETTSAALARVRQKLMQTDTRPIARSASLWRFLMRGNLAKLAVAAAILAVLGVLLGRVGPFGRGSIAWADVARQFQSVPFFNAAIYIKDGATSEPVQMELWWRHDGHTRLRIGTQVVFSLNGQAIRAFDVQTRQPVEPNRTAAGFLARIAEANEFSLDAVIDTMFGGQAKEVTPQVNASATISQDMVMFDIEMPHSPESVRIWALRESRLPIRIRIRNPHTGDASDAIFEYSEGQPEAFFDPNAFANLLGQQKSVSQANAAYVAPKNPDGKDVRNPLSPSENWDAHLAELAEYYKTHSLPEQAEVLEHSRVEEYSVSHADIPGMQGYYAVPLSGKLEDQVRRYRYPGSVGRVRLQADVSGIVLDHDLVWKTGASAAQKQLSILEHFGLEVVEVNEPRRVWVAHYDGRTLKNHELVRAPVRNDYSGKVKPGMMAANSLGGCQLTELFTSFMRYQDPDMKADGLLIIDETGITRKVSMEIPAWPGPEAIEPARKWFADEFGVTFTEETREMTTYVIRKKQ